MWIAWLDVHDVDAARPTPGSARLVRRTYPSQATGETSDPPLVVGALRRRCRIPGDVGPVAAICDLSSELWADAASRSLVVAFVVLMTHFVAVDALVSAQVALGFGDEPLPRLLRIAPDHTLPEICGYLMGLAASVALLRCWRVTRLRLHLFWSAAFALVVLDDAGRLHETLGDALQATGWAPAFLGLAGDDVGEMMVWLGLLLLLTPLLAVALGQRISCRAAAGGLIFFPLAILLVGCAVLGDAVQAWTKSAVAAYAEDGGELIALALIGATALALRRRHRPVARAARRRPAGRRPAASRGR